MPVAVAEELFSDLDSGRLSHAYAVFGADTVAMHRIFTSFASRAMCETHRGCGYCNACLLVAEGAHPDVKFYDGLDKFSTATANTLIEDTYQKGTMGIKKLYFIENAEGLSATVQNKLLKTFEEPPENVTFILGCATEGSLLPTVKSRVKKLYLAPYKEQELVDILVAEGEDTETAEKIAASCYGSLTRAMAMLSDADYIAQFDEVENVLLTLAKSSQLVEYIYRDVFSKEQLSLTLDFMEIILNDVLAVKAGQTLGILKDRIPDLKSIGNGWSTAGLAVAITKINLARKKFSVNIGATSIAESLLFDILEAKYKWQ